MKTELRPPTAGSATAPIRRTPYPGPRARRVLERMRQAEGAGLRTGSDEPALVLDNASGALLTDPDGNVFIDLYSSFAAANLGHTHPDVTAAIQRQAGRLTHVSSAFVSEARVDFEEALLEIAPRGLERVLLGITGADANELALKLARTVTGRHDVIAFSGGYFGRLTGVTGLNGKVAFRRHVGLNADAHFFPYPYPYRWRLGSSERAGEQVLEMLDDALEGGASGVAPPAAVFVEPIQGNGGVVVPPDDFLPGLRELCDRHGALLVFDEIQSGFGRTGRMWAGEHWNVVPDLMTVGKGIGGGMPVSAVLGRPEHMGHWPPGTHTSTFLTNAVNLVAGRAAIKAMQRDRLWLRAADLGRGLLERLKNELGDVTSVGEVRGLGLFIGIELVRDRDSRRPDAERAAIVARRAFEAGVVLGRGGHRDNVLKVSPPLTIDEEHLNVAIAITVDAIRGVG